ncbi:hypothetical protein XnspCFBP7698_09090 [Xanthomonas sp. CFBP 7698]|nr:hypothetical protein XnspCFBP7698_09090 [Xanthomonas sp. CFBP 7698]
MLARSLRRLPQGAGERRRSNAVEEPNKSALVLLQQEATELLALFDQLRGEAALDTDIEPCPLPRSTGAEPTVRVTN